MCNFLAVMVEAYGVGLWWSIGELSLFIGSAKEEYGIPHTCGHISQSLLLWIWPWKRDGFPCGPIFPYYHDEKYGSAGMALEVSTDPDKISGRFIGAHTNFEVVRSWFDNCHTDHDNTCQTDVSILQDIPGFRVIDCLSRRLVYWSELPATGDRDYVALSYVWGGTSDAEKEADTTKTDLGWTAVCQLPPQFPRLIEDTMTAVLELRFKYLWIDRYCIPQENTEAKHHQIQNMDRIYGSASLTIIAAAGKDPSYGLPGIPPNSTRSQCSLSASVRIGSRTFVTVGTHDTPQVVRDSAWNSRAWTMQEAFLSCRCLVFLDNGAYFQCNSPWSHRFESIREPPALLAHKHHPLCLGGQDETTIHDSIILTKGKGRAEESDFGWCLQLVKDYFTRNMTFESDSLDAFSGILQYMQSLDVPIHNLWGLIMPPRRISSSSRHGPSRYNLAWALTWLYKRDQRFFKKTHRQSTVFPRKNLFPSWSWLDWRSRTAINGQNFMSDHEIEFRCQHSNFTALVDLSVELQDGRVISLGEDYESISALATMSQPPRILHIHGYTSHPQLYYATEEQWRDLSDRYYDELPAFSYVWEETWAFHHWTCEEARAPDKKWLLIDADGQHFQEPFELRSRFKRWCWVGRWEFPLSNLSIDAHHLELQRKSHMVADTKTFDPCAFKFRIILLGYDTSSFFFMVLKEIPSTDNHRETFERVNVLHITHKGKPHALLSSLTGDTGTVHGTPWVEMSTRIA